VRTPLQVRIGSARDRTEQSGGRLADPSGLKMIGCIRHVSEQEGFFFA
jgi:hypothetical protein